mgnify:CR=1 FL=1
MLQEVYSGVGLDMRGFAWRRDRGEVSGLVPREACGYGVQSLLQGAAEGIGDEGGGLCQGVGEGLEVAVALMPPSVVLSEVRGCSLRSAPAGPCQARARSAGSAARARGTQRRVAASGHFSRYFWLKCLHGTHAAFHTSASVTQSNSLRARVTLRQQCRL